MAISILAVVYPLVVSASTCVAGAQPGAAPPTSPPAPSAPSLPATEPADPTKSFRRPGELVATCGAVSVKDLGKWPDMQAAMEGKGPMYVNRALQGAVNTRGDAVIVLDALPPDGVSRNKELGTVQFAIKSRPSTGVLNERGDLFGQLIIDNPGDAATQRYVTRTFILKAGDTAPTFIDAPEGHDLYPVMLGEDGTGMAQLRKGHFKKGEVSSVPVRIAPDAASGRYTIEHLIDTTKLPKGAMDCIATGIDARGGIAVGVQTPTGELTSMMMREDDGKMVQTCPSFVVTTSRAGIIRNGEIEMLPLPPRTASLSPSAVSTDGTLVCMADRWEGEARYTEGYIWKAGTFKQLKMFRGEGLVQPTGASGSLACGVMSLSDLALHQAGASGAKRREDPALAERIDQLRSSAVLWDLASGEYLTLDSLLPPGQPCSNINTAQAMKGNKVICTGYVNGEMHALVVTLPEGVAKGFAVTK